MADEPLRFVQLYVFDGICISASALRLLKFDIKLHSCWSNAYGLLLLCTGS